MSMPTKPTHAFVRGLAKTFAKALSQAVPRISIDVSRAHSQHEQYTQCLMKYVPQVVEVPADDTYPDCCFIEDTVLVLGSQVVFTRIGAETRLGETKAVKAAFEHLQKQIPQLMLHSLQAPALLDGGDVLQMGERIFVGRSHRTNQAAIAQLEAIFPDRVITVAVGEGLHLKSLLSALDDDTLILADSAAARAMGESISASFAVPPRLVLVPDREAANVLRLGSVVIIQEGFPESETILRQLALEKGLEVQSLCMSEFMKADGALTCCSVLMDFGSL